MPESLNAELARQIGSGLNNMHAALLEHQRASARDRGATLAKIDALSDKVDAKFDAFGNRLNEVCDKGGLEHRAFATRLDHVERRLDVQEARRQGQAQTVRLFADSGTWLLEHGWKLALVLFVGWQAISPTLERAARSGSAAAAPIEIRGYSR